MDGGTQAVPLLLAALMRRGPAARSSGPSGEDDNPGVQVVANRTFNVLPIVEGVYDMGNLAAVARSADGAPPDSRCTHPLLEALQCCIAHARQRSRMLSCCQLAAVV
jgi:hypothetical protein